jgi:hypothetical protein
MEDSYLVEGATGDAPSLLVSLPHIVQRRMSRTASPPRLLVVTCLLPHSGDLSHPARIWRLGGLSSRLVGKNRPVSWELLADPGRRLPQFPPTHPALASHPQTPASDWPHQYSRSHRCVCTFVTVTVWAMLCRFIRKTWVCCRRKARDLLSPGLLCSRCMMYSSANTLNYSHIHGQDLLSGDRIDEER